MGKRNNRKTNTVARKKNGVILPVAENNAMMPIGYTDFMTELKICIRQERTKAVLSANSALVMMYWEIGTTILVKQRESDWGAKGIDRMSYDLKEEFPDMTGFSPRNLKYMRKFAECWPDREIVQRVAAQISWRNNQALLLKKDEG